MSLKHIYEALEDLAADNSRLVKEEKIKKYLQLPYFEQTVIFAYDYNRKYHVTNIQLQKHEYDLSTKYIFEYLSYLATRNGATLIEKQNLSICSSFDPQTIEVVNRIINKDLKCGVGISTWKKYIKDLPVFEIMTCQKVVSKFLKWNGNKQYYWSIKKDGVRVICKVVEDTVLYHLSRSGIEYPNFGVFDSDLIKLAGYIHDIYKIPYPILIDGEAVGNKNFNKIMTQIRRLKDSNSDDFKFCVFDVPIDGYTFEGRYGLLEASFKPNKFNKLELLEHHLCCFNEEQVMEKMREVMRDGIPGIDEGIVIKMADRPYEFKEHSKWWCKVKPTDTLDLPVIGSYPGKVGTKYEDLVGGLIVDYNGVEVHVGSGLSDQQRVEFLSNLPTLIEVEFKEITPDGSLREPIMVRVRDDKNVTDSK